MSSGSRLWLVYSLCCLFLFTSTRYEYLCLYVTLPFGDGYECFCPRVLFVHSKWSSDYSSVRWCFQCHILYSALLLSIILWLLLFALVLILRMYWTVKLLCSTSAAITFLKIFSFLPWTVMIYVSLCVRCALNRKRPNLVIDRLGGGLRLLLGLIGAVGGRVLLLEAAGLHLPMLPYLPMLPWEASTICVVS